MAAGFGRAEASWSGHGGAFGVGLVNRGIRQEFAGGAVPAPNMNVSGFLFPIVSTLQFDATGHAQSSVSLTIIVNAGSSVVGQGSATAGAAFTGDYTVTSASGANYRFSTSPVPEGASMWMVLSGLVLLGCRKVRRV